jgi:hypothetical protein
MLVNINVEARVSGNPQALAKDGIRDHSAVFVALAPRPPLPPCSRPAPSFIFKTDTFQRIYDKFIQNIPIGGLGTVERWEVHKSILQETARRTRNALLRLQPRHREVELLVLNSVARAVATCSRQLAVALLDSSEVAREHLTIIDDKPDLIDPNRFTECITAARKTDSEVRESRIRRDQDPERRQLTFKDKSKI